MYHNILQDIDTLLTCYFLQSAPPDSMVTTALPHVHILSMGFSVKKYVTVRIHPVIISMVAMHPHEV